MSTPESTSDTTQKWAEHFRALKVIEEVEEITPDWVSPQTWQILEEIRQKWTKALQTPASNPKDPSSTISTVAHLIVEEWKVLEVIWQELASSAHERKTALPDVFEAVLQLKGYQDAIPILLENFKDLSEAEQKQRLTIWTTLSAQCFKPILTSETDNRYGKSRNKLKEICKKRYA